MIRLKRPEIPDALDKAAPDAVDELWKAWNKGTPLEVKASVYAHTSVKKALRKAQQDKCAYCETKNPTSHDVVEHYRPKNGWRQDREDPLHYPEYFWLAYDWGNLLFACDQCNDGGHKQNLFPLENPHHRATAVDKDIPRERPLILNPYGSKDPKNHPAWNRDVPRPKNGSRYGRVTISTFRLDKDSLLLTERRRHFNQTEIMLAATEMLPVGHPTRIEMQTILQFRASDGGPWAAMVKANLGERIAALQQPVTGGSSSSIFARTDPGRGGRAKS